MSRGLKAPFKEYEGQKQKDKHIRLTKSMLDSENFKSLQPTSVLVYMYMKLWANGNTEVAYSQSLGSKIVSPVTFRNAIKELNAKGFIQTIYFSNGGGRKPNCYQFSSNWSKKLS